MKKNALIKNVNLKIYFSTKTLGYRGVKSIDTN